MPKITGEDIRDGLLLHFAECPYKVTSRSSSSLSIRTLYVSSNVLERVIFKQLNIWLWNRGLDYDKLWKRRDDQINKTVKYNRSRYALRLFHVLRRLLNFIKFSDELTTNMINVMHFPQISRLGRSAILNCTFHVRYKYLPLSFVLGTSTYLSVSCYNNYDITSNTTIKLNLYSGIVQALTSEFHVRYQYNYLPLSFMLGTSTYL